MTMGVSYTSRRGAGTTALQKLPPGGRVSRRNEFRRCMAFGRLSLRDKMHCLLGQSRLAKNDHSFAVRSRLCLLFTMLGLARNAVPAYAQQFVDPAPPVVAKLADMLPPPAKPQPGLKFHAAPRPLAAGAVTHDWKSFLG